MHPKHADDSAEKRQTTTNDSWEPSKLLANPADACSEQEVCYMKLCQMGFRRRKYIHLKNVMKIVYKMRLKTLSHNDILSKGKVDLHQRERSPKCVYKHQASNRSCVLG